MVCEYILYKNPIQYDTLYIVQYLHYLGIILKPQYCIERNYPSWVTSLPSIYVSNNDKKYIGLEECIKFFQQESGVNNVLYKSNEFKKLNPEYRIQGC